MSALDHHEIVKSCRMVFTPAWQVSYNGMGVRYKFAPLGITITRVSSNSSTTLYAKGASWSIVVRRGNIVDIKKGCADDVLADMTLLRVMI